MSMKQSQGLWNAPPSAFTPPKRTRGVAKSTWPFGLQACQLWLLGAPGPYL